MKVELEFGAMARPIRAQLRAQHVHLRINGAKEIARCQQDADAVTRLSLRNVLTDAQRASARRRVMLAVVKYCFAGSAGETETRT